MNKMATYDADRGTGGALICGGHGWPRANVGRFVQADIIIDGLVQIPVQNLNLASFCESKRKPDDTQGWNRQAPGWCHDLRRPRMAESKYMYVQGNPIAKWDPTGRATLAEVKSNKYFNDHTTERMEVTVSGAFVDKGEGLHQVAEQDLRDRLKVKVLTPKNVAAHVKTIMALNGLKSDVLQPGQFLVTGIDAKFKGQAGIGDAGVFSPDVMFSVLKTGAVLYKNLSTAATSNIAELSKSGALIVKDSVSGAQLKSSGFNLLKAFLNSTPYVKGYLVNMVGKQALIESAKIGTGFGTTGIAWDILNSQIDTGKPISKDTRFEEILIKIANHEFKKINKLLNESNKDNKK